MKKLSEYKDEEALDMLADLIDPVVDIFGDKEVAKYYRGGVVLEAVKLAIKNHKKSVMKMLSILEGVPEKEYHCNLLTVPKVLVGIFNDPELKDFFTEQSEMISEDASGSATENIEESQNTSSNI
jgi:hypothetical protein